MATGKLAFGGESTATIFDSILNREPVDPLRLNPELPPKLDEIISKALEKDRNLRYQHAADMRADLQRLKRDKAPAVSSRLPPPPVNRKRAPSVPARPASPLFTRASRLFPSRTKSCTGH